MSDPYGSYPPDEPVIGATYPPRGTVASPPEPYIGDDEEQWDDGYDDEYGYDEDPYYDEGYDESPARQPMFYVFIALAALIGGIVIFLLFSVVNNNGGGDGGTAPSDFKVFVDSPTPNQRIEINTDQDVTVRAKASETITKFELFIGSDLKDSYTVTQPPAADGTYSATLKLPGFTQKGNYQIKVRVTGASGAHKDSDPFTVIAIEPVGAKPQQIKGKLLTDASARQGPDDASPAVQTVTAGSEVTILGKTRDGQWLLVDINGGLWLKNSAVSAEDSLSLVPIKDPTPVPQPTPIDTPLPSPSPSATATANAKAPDFSPTNATVSNGQVHVTIANLSTNSYTGAIVVSVSGLTGQPLVQAFNVNIPANGSAIVDFAVDVSGTKSAAVKVDPDNAIKEINEDNNSATFQLKPAEEAPNLTVSASAAPNGQITAIISNSGGALKAPGAKIRVTLNGDSNEKTVGLNIDKGATQTVPNISPPDGKGTATIEVVINGTTLATTTVDLT